MFRFLRKHRSHLALLSIMGLMLRLASVVVTPPAVAAGEAVAGPASTHLVDRISTSMPVVICTAHGTMTVSWDGPGSAGVAGEDDLPSDRVADCPLCFAFLNGLSAAFDATPQFCRLGPAIGSVFPLQEAAKAFRLVVSHAPRGPPSI